jgi:uncharacterized membrane protein YagU involved in acid resistance
MSTNISIPSTSSPLSRAVLNGVLGGIAGGIVFGIMMATQGMLPMVGMLIGQDNAVVGFFVHMVISVIIGAVFGLAAPRLPRVTWGVVLVVGAIYGVIWWVLGALVMMPLMLGMNDMVFSIGQPQIMSLIGHMVFGVILAGVYKVLATR